MIEETVARRTNCRWLGGREEEAGTEEVAT